MSGPRVAVLHQPFGAASLHDLRRAAAGVCQPVLVLTERTAGAHPDLRRAAEALFPVAVAAHGDVLAAVRPWAVQGVTTFHDQLLEQTAVVAAGLGLPGMPTAHAWDKLVQRQLLAGAGLTRARALPVDGAEDLRRGVAALGLPLVLKPRRGVGGEGVALLHTADDVDYQCARRRQGAQRVLETMLPPGRHPAGDRLADFVSVETVHADGAHRHVAVFDKREVTVLRHAGADGADLVTVSGDVLPTRLPGPDLDALLRYTSDCMRALDVRWRVTHTEIKLTPHGPDVIEVNGRMGGHLNRLLRLVGGPDLARAALTAALGHDTGPAQPWQATGYAAGLFPSFPRRDGVVRSRVTAADLRSLPGVRGIDEVAQAGRPTADTGHRMVNLTLTAADATELDERIHQTTAAVERLFGADLEAAR